jgi:LruC domain-containing protein
VFPETIFVGYEDLPEGEGNDYDYNDFLVRLDTEFDVQQTDSGFEVNVIRFDIVPRARGATFEHVFHMLFPADSLCDGRYDLTVYDVNGDVIPTDSVSGQLFTGSADVDIVIFEDTGQIFPDRTNQFGGVACEEPGRTAQLTITFDEECPFDIEGIEPTKPNGSGLFFNPYITVNQSNDEIIDTGDERLLTVPDTWLWPLAGVPIWEVYDEVDENNGLPVFTTETWFDGGYDDTLVYDECP